MKFHDRQLVNCNGFPGVVTKICDGQLAGMVEVRLGSGTVCVDASEVKPPVYKNLNFKKRDYECTNVVAAQAVDFDHEQLPTYYVPAESSVLDGLTRLWVEEGIQYWGWL